jgi:ribosome-associated heat shock protein Hsp15
MSDKVRLDKWLWSVRLYKSRTLAADAIKAGKVKSNNKDAKTSSPVTIGDRIILKRNGFNFEYVVNTIIKTRVSAVLAAPCYTNITPEEELNKYKSWFIGKGNGEQRGKGLGRPTKKERRDIDEFKDDIYEDPFNWVNEDGEEE